MCIFCQIIAGEIPSYKVYEDEKIIALLDIKPVNPGDILAVVKKHYRNFEEITEEDFTALMLVSKKMGALLKEKLGAEGYNLSVNNDPAAGQTIPHVHVHLIPRHADDGHLPWRQSAYAPGEAEEVLKKLSA